MQEDLENYVLLFFEKLTQELCLSSVGQERKLHLGQIPALGFFK